MAAARLKVTDTVRQQLQQFINEQALPVELVDTDDASVCVAQAEPRRECGIDQLYPGGWITCGVARQVALRLNISLKHTGMLLNLLDIKVRQCELGLLQ